MQLYSPWALLLLLVVPVMAYLMLRKKGTAAVRFPSLVDMRNCSLSWRIRSRPLLKVARLVCVVLLIMALAGYLLIYLIILTFSTAAINNPTTLSRIIVHFFPLSALLVVILNHED